MKNRFSAMMILVASALISLTGFTPAAEGAGSASSNFGGGVVINGFDISYGGDETQGQSFVYMNIVSPTHRIDQANSYFRTDISDPSEAWGDFYCFGRRNLDLNHDSMNMSFSMERDGLFFSQTSSLQFYEKYYPYGEVNSAFCAVTVSFFDLLGGNAFYNEHVFPDQPNTVYFVIHLSFYGSFGPGAEGDARGMAFLPTPGTFSLAGLGGLPLLRRERRR